MRYYDWNITNDDPRVLSHIKGSVTRVGKKHNYQYEARPNGAKMKLKDLCRDAKDYVLSCGKEETS